MLANISPRCLLTTPVLDGPSLHLSLRRYRRGGLAVFSINLAVSVVIIIAVELRSAHSGNLVTSAMCDVAAAEATRRPSVDPKTIPHQMDLSSQLTTSADADESIYESAHQRILNNCKAYGRMVLPHVGLVILLGAYTVCGAGVFHMIEYPNELRVRQQILDSIWLQRQQFTDMVWNLTQNYTLDEQDWRQAFLDHMHHVELALYKAFDNRLIAIEDLKNNSQVVWSFPASIFFASTVITTIGYGHMVPSTLPGRIFCIVFGLFGTFFWPKKHTSSGIPLLLVTIADIGKFLSDLIHFVYRLYQRLKVALMIRSRRLSYRRRDALSNLDISNKEEQELQHEADAAANSDAADDIHIPVWMIILFLTSYTALGGVLFQMWEGWDYFKAFYFCFITMTTIGFGDTVPSKPEYMFFTMIYIVIGLAITTMCIDLAGTEYIRKIHYFGSKMETAKEKMGVAMITGLQVGGDLMKHVKTAGERFIGGDVINFRDLAILRRRGMLPEDFDLASIDHAGLLNLLNQDQNDISHNVLYRPINPVVVKCAPKNIKLSPDEIQDTDGIVLQNRMFGKSMAQQQYQLYKKRKKHAEKYLDTIAQPDTDDQVIVLPFLMRESNV